MEEIRCKMCDKLLGKFNGQGEIKCSRSGCGAVNSFDTVTGKQEILKQRKHITMKERKTSSGVTFG